MRKLSLTPQKQLIDLNEDATLFELDVNVKTENPDGEFDAVILTQTELDIGNFDYRHFKGGMQAHLKNDKNIYQNHFICMKSDKKQNVFIDIKQHPAPYPVEESPIIPPPIIPQIPSSLTKKESIFTWKTILIILAVIGIGIGLYFMWESNSKETSESCNTVVTEVVENIIPTSPVKKVGTTSKGKASSPNLMARLNKIVDN